MAIRPSNWLILGIICLAFFVRSYHLNITPSLNPDEAALGYNAYSLLETGRDEHGVSWPLHFKSFGDFKPGGYVYLAMPFIKILGLTPLAVRLPNLILSVLTILILFKLVLLITEDSRLALLVSFVLAINPWHIHFSRGAWESSAALFFIILGIYLFYSYLINLKSYFFLLSCFSFVASLYIYHSARLISPLIVIFLITTNFRLLIFNYKKLIVPILMAIIITIPVLMSFLNNGGTTRLGGVGLSADYGPIARAEELLNHHGNVDLYNRIIHNRRLLYFISWSQKYLSHFDFNFLFLNGDDVPRSKSPDIGQFYLIELPLMIAGIIYLFKIKSNIKLLLLTVSLLFISPIASSLTFQSPSALRSLPLTIPLSILVASGLSYFLQTSVRLFPHNIFGLSLLYVFSFFYFIDSYFVHAPQRYPFAWNTGFSELIPFIDSQKSKYEHIYVTDTYDQPYILYLFYSKYDPSHIQSQIKLTPPDNFGFSTVRQIDNIIFDKIDWNKIPTNSLVISASEKIPIEPKASVIFPGGTIGFRIYEK